jgi:hypothetical protein
MDGREDADGIVGEIKGGELELHGVSEGAAECSSEPVDGSPVVLSTQTGSSPP